MDLHRQGKTKRARELLDKIQYMVHSKGAGIPKLEQLQHFLSDYHIPVHQNGSKIRDIKVGGNDHIMNYTVITSLTQPYAVICLTWVSAVSFFVL